MPRIPYGTKYTVQTTGSRWKPVACENCGSVYYYKVTAITSGSATDVLWLNKEATINKAENNASQSIERSLENATRNYSCPDCGFYQTYMIHRMRNSIWLKAISFGALAVVIIGVISSSVFFALTAGIIVCGFFIIQLANFDPNNDARSRINKQFSESYPVIKKSDIEATFEKIQNEAKQRESTAFRHLAELSQQAVQTNGFPKLRLAANGKIQELSKNKESPAPKKSETEYSLDQVEKTNEPSKLRKTSCSKCGEYNFPNEIYCQGCGERLNSISGEAHIQNLLDIDTEALVQRLHASTDEPKIANSVVTETRATTHPIASDYRTCLKCHHSNLRAASVCERCGTNL